MFYGILIFIMLTSWSLSAQSAQPSAIDAAVQQHRARVADFYSRIEKAKRDALRARDGVEALAAWRAAQAKEKERVRLQYVAQKKKEDPRAEFLREQAYLAELARREKIKETERKGYVGDRERIRRAIASEKQIPPMLEYNLNTNWEIQEKGQQP